MHAHLATIDYVILSIYFAFVLGIGWALKCDMRGSSDFLTASYSIPVWIAALAFISANLGAQEVIGMGLLGLARRRRTHGTHHG